LFNSKLNRQKSGFNTPLKSSCSYHVSLFNLISSEYYLQPNSDKNLMRRMKNRHFYLLILSIQITSVGSILLVHRLNHPYKLVASIFSSTFAVLLQHEHFSKI